MRPRIVFCRWLLEILGDALNELEPQETLAASGQSRRGDSHRVLPPGLVPAREAAPRGDGWQGRPTCSLGTTSPSPALPAPGRCPHPTCARTGLLRGKKPLGLEGWWRGSAGARTGPSVSREDETTEVRPCGAGWSSAFTSRPCTPWAPPGSWQSYRDPEAWARDGGRPSPAAPELRSPGCDRPPARDQQRGRVGVNPPSVHFPPGHGDMLELPSAKPGPRPPRAGPEPG